MISQKYIDLMNQEIDGANTPGQTRELEEFLQENEEARDYFRELALALNVFEKVAMVDPPPGLSAAILEGASTVPETEKQGNEGGLWAAIGNLFNQRPRLAHSLTFTAGLICGLILLTGSSWLDNRHGTALNDDVLGTASSRVWDTEAVTEGAWHDPAIQGQFRSLQDGQDLRLHLEMKLNGRGSYDLEFHQSNENESRIKMSVYSEGRLVHTESLNGEK
jgi:hypothetical protein